MIIAASGIIGIRKESQMNCRKTSAKIITLGLGLTALCFLACSPTNTFSPLEKATSIKKSDFVVGPEDVLKIHVWKQESISVTVPVRSDGKISIPLINDVQAAGFTPNQLKDKIAERLKKFIDEPTVSVIVVTINSLKVIVSGNVNAPGVYNIGREISLVEAISLAGGLAEFADPDKIKIIRKENGIDKIFEVNYSAILSGEDLKQNIALVPGDSVVVP
jgi:polysaccharide export outer membrane protein